MRLKDQDDEDKEVRFTLLLFSFSSFFSLTLPSLPLFFQEKVKLMIQSRIREEERKRGLEEEMRCQSHFLSQS